MSQKSYPKFLCIGAQRAGTTWLFVNLLYHPEVWLPPIKEIHYLSRRDQGRLASYKRFRVKRWREKSYHTFKRDMASRSYHNLAWDIKYYFGLWSDKWYESIFKPGKDKISGDITPAYSKMDERAVAHTYAIMPHAKIIFIMRDPIERAWSHARMRFDKKMDLYKKSEGDFNNIDDNILIQHFKKKEVILRGDYLRTMKIWESQYPSKQIFYAFTEDIARRPRELLLDIYKFIGVEVTDKYVPQQAEKKVTQSVEYKMPEIVSRYLAEYYHEQIKQLAERFSCLEVNYAEEWLKKQRERFAQREYM